MDHIFIGLKERNHFFLGLNLSFMIYKTDLLQ